MTTHPASIVERRSFPENLRHPRVADAVVAVGLLKDGERRVAIDVDLNAWEETQAVRIACDRLGEKSYAIVQRRDLLAAPRLARS